MGNQSDIKQATAGKRRATFALSALLMTGTLALAYPTYAQTFAGLPFTYSGRMTEASGSPKVGPLDISATFWTAESGGTQLGQPFDFPAVTLQEGVFSLNFELAGSQVQDIFRDGSEPVYIEVATAEKKYPRQRFTFIPLAMRVPVDNKTLSFDTTTGQLGIKGAKDASSGNVLTRDSTGGVKWDTLHADSLVAKTQANGDASNDQVLTFKSGKWVAASLPATVANGNYLSALTGDVIASGPGSGTATLAAVAIPGTATKVTYDAKGRVTAGTSLTSSDITTALGFSPLNAVHIATGTGLAGGPITNSGTISLANTTVTAGTYARANVAVDAQGRLTSAANGAAITNSDIAANAAIAPSKIAGLDSSLAAKENLISASTTADYFRGDKTWQPLTTLTVPESAPALYYSDARARSSLTGTAPINYNFTTGVISIPVATNAANGYLSSLDWTTFNSKQNAIGYAPVNKSGDTMTGALNMNDQPLVAVGNVILSSAKTLGLGVFDSSSEPLMTAQLNNSGAGSPDKGKTWFNTSTNEVKYWDGSAAKALGVSGAGLTNLNGVTASSQTFVTGSSGNAPTITSGGSSHTLNIPMASASATVTAGLISNSDYVSFANKVNVVAAGSGISVATASGTVTVSLANVGSAGTYAKVITNAQGQVTAGATLAGSDIPNLDAAKITTGQIAVANGGTGIASGVSGGVPYYSGASTMSSSAALTPNGIILGGGIGGAPTATAALTNGQLLIGSTGNAPVPGTLGSGATGTISVTNNPGSIVLDTVQDIRTSATPTFAGLRVSGITVNSLLKSNGSGYLTSAGSSDVISTLGFTPLSRNGDTMTGTLNMNSQAITNAGNVMISAAKTLGLGVFDNSSEATMIASLDNSGTSSPDKGKTWFNSTSSQIKYWTGSAAQALGVSGAGLTNLNGLTGNTQTFANGASGNSPMFSSSGAVHTLNIPLASVTGVTAGLISNSDFTNFNSKLGGVAAGTGMSVSTASGTATVNLSAVGTAGTYTRVQTNAQGQVVSGGALSENDIPSLDASKISTGQISVASGGTGVSAFTNNGVVIGSGTALSSTAAGAPYNILTVNSSNQPTFGAINLASGNAVSGVLATTNGGTGLISTATFPTSGVVATRDATETLTNKTLSAATINGASSIGGSTTISTTGTVNSGAQTVAGNVTILGNNTAANKLVLNDKGSANSVSLKAPDTLASSLTLELPSTNGSSGQVLSTNGTGTLSWVSAAVGSVTSVTGTAPISVATGTSTPVISMSQANGSISGYLSSADWTSFNSKQASGNYLTALTGDITTSGFTSGSATATLATVTTPGMSTKVTYDAKGRVTSGTSLTAADIPALSAALITSGTLAVANGGTGVTSASANSVFAGPTSSYGAPSFRTLGAADLPAMGGANGTSAGTAGAVPGPAATDNIKFLRGDGTWATPAASAAGSTSQIQYNNGGLLTGSANFVYSGGNVGIGTTAPTAALTITVPTGKTPISTFAGAGGQWQLGQNVGPTSNDDTFGLYSYTKGGGAIWTATTTGNIGIGTTEPAARLSFGNSSGGQATMHLWDGGTGSRVGMGINTNETQFFTTSAAHFSFNKGGDFQTIGSNELMRIGSDGYVGIGTTAPGYVLTVQSPVQYQGIALNNASNLVAVLDGKSATNDDGQLALYSGGSLKTLISANNFSYITGGNVGIGTTAPVDTLDVSGTVVRNGDRYRFTLPNITTSTWYKLGTWTSTAQGSRAEVTFHAAVGYSAFTSSNGQTRLFLSTGNQLSAPNITGYFWSEGGSPILTDIRANANSSCSGNGTTCMSWDIYGYLNTFAGPDNFYEVKTGINSTWAQVMTASIPVNTANISQIFSNSLNLSGGNVGIGTTAPTAALDIGTGSISMGYEIIVNTCPSGTACTATCTSGKFVLGGGCDLATGTVQQTKPVSNNSWNCLANSATYMNVFAICARMK